MKGTLYIQQKKQQTQQNIYNIPVDCRSQTSRSSKPYHATELNAQDFYGFKQLSEKLKNFEFKTNDEKVYWNSIKSISLMSKFDYHNDYPAKAAQ